MICLLMREKGPMTGGDAQSAASAPAWIRTGKRESA
ncbi:MAG: hypothetical protein QOG73_126, partial [Acetobacteraceae bacterium]|nr:hypothetical protein [Acetobacteraceae bacterium]